MENNSVTHASRQEITDQIMYQVARLMPAEYRGVYADLSNAKTEYLVFD